MKHLLSTISISFIFALSSTHLTAQAFQKTANEAYIITRMINKYHILPKNIDEDFSKAVYNLLLDKLDDERVFFTQEDIAQLNVFSKTLHTEVLQQKTFFLQLITNIYTKRLQQADSAVNKAKAIKLNFNIPDVYTTKEDTTYPINTVALHQKLSKLIKLQVGESLVAIADEMDWKTISKQSADSLEPIVRKEICENISRILQKKLQYPGGIQQLIASEYCSAIANYFDPHTEYFTTTQKENFESALGKKNMVFGFNLLENNNGDVEINSLLPGSPAFKSGEINKGDKIISIQWEGSQAIDVSKASVQEISQILSTSNHTKATIVFLKADGTKREVTLGKELATNEEDDDKVMSFILKGEKNIGYIALPSFYEDWEDENSINGCSNDVAKEIIKLKKENIDGLILDLRYNGGGSVKEAIELAGIFIDAGPIAQWKTREAKIQSLKDINRGTIYDGPLTLLVNGFSASASELVAGALQDYNRAVIIGSPTYGKATGQRVLPIDTTINIKEFEESNIKEGAIKITLSQLYQVSGKTAQFKGVIPDVILPDATDAFNKKERNEPFAIPSNNIEANKYYLPLNPLPIKLLKEKATEYVKEDAYFDAIKKYIATKKIAEQKVDVSLKLADMLKQQAINNENDKIDDENEVDNVRRDKINKSYTVKNNNYMTERLNTNADLHLLNNKIINRLSKDSYIAIAYKLLLLMNK